MQDKQRNVVIVGASAAGLRCASRLARLKPDWRIRVVEQREIFSYSACGLPYVLSGDIEDLQTLRNTKDGSLRDAGYFASVKGVEVLTGSRAESIDPQSKKLRVSRKQGGLELDYDELVLATGARAKSLPGQPEHARVRTFHNFEDVEPLVEDLAHGRIRRVVVAGAGLLGCELAEAFSAMWGAEVTLVEAARHPLPNVLDHELGSMVIRVLGDRQVNVQTDCGVDRIEADDTGVKVFAGKRAILADVVVVALGAEPVVDLARQAGIRLGQTGAISVDQRLATSMPHIWAVGDCVEVMHAVCKQPVRLLLGSLANRQGRTLANVLAGHLDRFPHVVGACAVKIFDHHVVATGINRAEAQAQGIPHRTVWISAQDRADYWPEVKDLFVQLLYQPDSHRVLGVQALGEGEVAKRIDVASQLMAQGASLEDFSHLEHAYAPPFAPALDPLAVAAMVALNQEDGLVAVSPLHPLDGNWVLDVRHFKEREAMPVQVGKLVSIAQDEIRTRFSELSSSTKDSGPDVGAKEWLSVCARGARSAEVARWLLSKGLRVRYLGGGLRWRSLAGKPSGPTT